MTGELFWLSDEQWERIKAYVPADGRGSRRMDDRRVISAVVHVLKSGCRWSECSEVYRPRTAIYNRFARWARRGIWDTVFRELARESQTELERLIEANRVAARRRSRRLAARIEGANRRSAYSQMLRDE